MSKALIVVSALIEADNQFLLCLRGQTEHCPHQWSLPIGHVEKLENCVDALRRELFEELGLQMIDCELFTTLIDNEQKIENHIYRLTQWRGKITNREPELCDAVRWFSLDNLPSPLTTATQSVLKSL